MKNREFSIFLKYITFICNLLYFFGEYDIIITIGFFRNILHKKEVKK